MASYKLGHQQSPALHRWGTSPVKRGEELCQSQIQLGKTPEESLLANACLLMVPSS